MSVSMSVSEGLGGGNVGSVLGNSDDTREIQHGTAVGIDVRGLKRPRTEDNVTSDQRGGEGWEQGVCGTDTSDPRSPTPFTYTVVPKAQTADAGEGHTGAERVTASAVGRRDQVVVADMMAGVGPFAVPLAKNGVTVHANGEQKLDLSEIPFILCYPSITLLLLSYRLKSRVVSSTCE